MSQTGIPLPPIMPKATPGLPETLGWLSIAPYILQLIVTIQGLFPRKGYGQNKAAVVKTVLKANDPQVNDEEAQSAIDISVQAMKAAEHPAFKSDD